MSAGVRLVTFNCAVGNPRITTPEEAFLELPFYREAFAGDDAAPLLALQEVGRTQADLLDRARGSAVVLHKRRPGQGNALVIPDRYAVTRHAAGYYLAPQVRGIVAAVRGRRRNWRQYGELRMWIEARLHDRATGRDLTVVNTHLSFDRDLNPPQLDAAVRRIAAGPAILAGDLNTRPPAAIASGPGELDHVLATGFALVSDRVWTEIALSDHAPLDVTLAYR